jgi:hypothetical protein
MAISGTHTTVDPTRLATRREDLVTVLLGACLIGGVLADGWAHVNLASTLEGFFTPWHGLLYAGFTATAAWTFWLAYQRRDRAPVWWRDGWPAGYRVGGLGVLVFLVGGLADMVWHETLGVEVGLDAAFSPSHLMLVTGGVLLLSSPLRSWWAAGPDGRRAATGVASLALATVAPTIVLTHSSPFAELAPIQPYDAALAEYGGPDALVAVAGVDSYLVTTLVLVVPLLMAHRRRATPGAATAVTGGVALFTMAMFEFPDPSSVAALTAVGAAAVADVLLLRLDALRGTDAPLRLPIAGALFAGLVWAGHLLGLSLRADLGWPAEIVTGVVVLSAVVGALLGGLAARPAPAGSGPAPAHH